MNTDLRRIRPLNCKCTVRVVVGTVTLCSVYVCAFAVCLSVPVHLQSQLSMFRLILLMCKLFLISLFISLILSTMWVARLQMEKGDKGSTMIRMGVSGWMFLLVPAYPGCPGSKAVKRSLLLLYVGGFVAEWSACWT